MYEYYHQEDVTALAETHKAVLEPPHRLTTADYHFRTKEHGYVRLQSEWKAFINPWTKDFEYLVAKNSLILYVYTERTSDYSANIMQLTRPFVRHAAPIEIPPNISCPPSKRCTWKASPLLPFFPATTLTSSIKTTAATSIG